MENTEKIVHHEMVAALVKPGSDIIDTLDPAKAHLLHMAVGVAGESAELLAAFNGEYIDHENALEELGDLEFYLEGVRQGAGIARHETLVVCQEGTIYDSPDIGIAIEGGNLLDTIKKVVIYNKPVDRMSIVLALGAVEFYMEEVRRSLGFSREQTLEANIEKLGKRYVGLKYSDKAAQLRADKQPVAA